MNIRDLKYLVALADYRHFGNAAEACFVSQPALSMQIKKLENTLGVQLIERSNKNVFLTNVGEELTAYARDILCRVDEMLNAAKHAKDPLSGELHIGVIPTLAPYLLPHIMPYLVKQFPKLKIFLHEAQTESLIKKLKQGILDTALLALPIIDQDLMTIPLFEEELLLALPAKHELIKQSTIKSTDLANKTLLLLEDGHCLRDQALSLCHVVGAYVNQSFQATSLETLRHMVISNAGITLMPKLACREMEGLHYRSFHSPKPTRLIGLLSRVSTSKKILLENITAQIKKKMSNTAVTTH